MLALLFEGGLGVLAWVLGAVLGPAPLGDLHWDSRSALLGIVATVPMLLGLLACLRLPIEPLRRIKRISRTFIGPLFARCSVFELAVISATAGVCEEMLFRGFLQNLLMRHLGTWPGLLLASAVFGLVHAITPAYAVLAAVFGAYLGTLWLRSENLLAPILAHALYDFLALLYLVRRGIK
jgi:membrane protease YdiL (CAAX protease family)